MSTFRAHSEFADPNPQHRRRSHRGWRILAWIAGSLVLLVIVCGIGLVALVNTDGVHRYLIGLAQQEASKQLGVRVQLQNFTLHWSGLSLDLYGITVDGAAPYREPALLEADHIAVGVRVISVFGRKWYLDNLQIDHPVVWVLIDKNGVSNLPKLQGGSDSNGGTTNIFDLGIRHAVLDRGEIYFNMRPLNSRPPIARDCIPAEVGQQFLISPTIPRWSRARLLIFWIRAMQLVPDSPARTPRFQDSIQTLEPIKCCSRLVARSTTACRPR